MIYHNSSGLVLLNDCVCPGEEVTFECTVCGILAATVWTGSLFDCAGGEILLRHRQFEYGSAIGECNNGTVVARSIGVSDVNGSYCYSSQLNVIINSVMNNKTVTCLQIYSTNVTVIDTLTINITTGDKIHRWRKEIYLGERGEGRGLTYIHRNISYQAGPFW